MPAKSSELARRDAEADRFLWRPLAWWLGAVAAFSLIYVFAFELAFLVVLLAVYLSLALAPVGLFLVLAAAVGALKRGLWRRALSMIALTILIGGTPLFPSVFLRPFIVLGLKAQFALEHRALEAEVAAMPTSDRPLDRFFDKGDSGPWSLYTIYDEDDHLTRAPSIECDLSLIHLRGHYYSCLGYES